MVSEALLETKACFVAHTNVEAWKRSLVREWAKIPKEHYRAAVDQFPRRLDNLLMLTEAILKIKLQIDSYVYFLLYCIFFVIFAYICIINKAKTKFKDFLSTLLYMWDCN